VGLAEIHGFQWVIGCFSLVFAGLARSRSAGVGLKLVWGLKIGNWIYQGD